MKRTINKISTWMLICILFVTMLPVNAKADTITIEVSIDLPNTDGTETQPSSKLKVKNVKGSTLYLKKKQSFTVKTNSNVKDLSFKIKDKKVASVNSKGKVVAKKDGDTKLIITQKKNPSVKCTLPIRVTGNLKVTNASELKKLNKDSFVTIKTNYKSKDLTFKSSNVKVARVDKNGQLLALKAGKTTISITSKANKKTIKINVAVTNNRKGETKEIAKVRKDVEKAIKKMGVQYYPDTCTPEELNEWGYSGGMSWFEGRVATATYQSDIDGIASNYDGCEVYWIEYSYTDGNDIVFTCYWG